MNKAEKAQTNAQVLEWLGHTFDSGFWGVIELKCKDGAVVLVRQNADYLPQALPDVNGASAEHEKA